MSPLESRQLTPSAARRAAPSGERLAPQPQGGGSGLLLLLLGLLLLALWWGSQKPGLNPAWLLALLVPLAGGGAWVARRRGEAPTSPDRSVNAGQGQGKAQGTTFEVASQVKEPLGRHELPETPFVRPLLEACGPVWPAEGWDLALHLPDGEAEAEDLRPDWIDLPALVEDPELAKARQKASSLKAEVEGLSSLLSGAQQELLEDDRHDKRDPRLMIPASYEAGATGLEQPEPIDPWSAAHNLPAAALPSLTLSPGRPEDLERAPLGEEPGSDLRASQLEALDPGLLEGPLPADEPGLTLSRAQLEGLDPGLSEQPPELTEDEGEPYAASLVDAGALGKVSISSYAQAEGERVAPYLEWLEPGHPARPAEGPGDQEARWAQVEPGPMRPSVRRIAFDPLEALEEARPPSSVEAHLGRVEPGPLVRPAGKILPAFDLGEALAEELAAPGWDPEPSSPVGEVALRPRPARALPADALLQGEREELLANAGAPAPILPEILDEGSLPDRGEVSAPAVIPEILDPQDLRASEELAWRPLPAHGPLPESEWRSEVDNLRGAYLRELEAAGLSRSPWAELPGLILALGEGLGLWSEAASRGPQDEWMDWGKAQAYAWHAAYGLVRRCSRGRYPRLARDLGVEADAAWAARQILEAMGRKVTPGLRAKLLEEGLLAEAAGVLASLAPRRIELPAPAMIAPPEGRLTRLGRSLRAFLAGLGGRLLPAKREPRFKEAGAQAEIRVEEAVPQPAALAPADPIPPAPEPLAAPKRRLSLQRQLAENRYRLLWLESRRGSEARREVKLEKARARARASRALEEELAALGERRFSNEELSAPGHYARCAASYADVVQEVGHLEDASEAVGEQWRALPYESEETSLCAEQARASELGLARWTRLLAHVHGEAKDEAGPEAEAEFRDLLASIDQAPSFALSRWAYLHAWGLEDSCPLPPSWQRLEGRVEAANAAKEGWRGWMVAAWSWLHPQFKMRLAQHQLATMIEAARADLVAWQLAPAPEAREVEEAARGLVASLDALRNEGLRITVPALDRACMEARVRLLGEEARYWRAMEARALRGESLPRPAWPRPSGSPEQPSSRTSSIPEGFQSSEPQAGPEGSRVPRTAVWWLSIQVRQFLDRISDLSVLMQGGMSRIVAGVERRARKVASWSGQREEGGSARQDHLERLRERATAVDLPKPAARKGGLWIVRSVRELFGLFGARRRFDRWLEGDPITMRVISRIVGFYRSRKRRLTSLIRRVQKFYRGGRRPPAA